MRNDLKRKAYTHKRIKKGLLIGFAACMTCAVATGLASCSADYSQYPVGEDYVYNYDNPLRAKTDAFMHIDGKLNEKIWEEQNFLEWHDDAGDLIKATTVFTSKGLYVGALAYDEAVYWGARHIYYRDVNTGQKTNSNFFIQIAKDDEVNWNGNKTSLHPTSTFDFNVDALYSLSKRERSYDAKGYCEGTLNGETISLGAELFLPWSEMGYTEMPEKVRILIQYKSPSGGAYPGFTDDGKYQTYYSYDKDGAMLYFDDNGSVGNAVGGECASDQWEIDEENKTAETDVYRTQVLFMRKDSAGDLCSKAENYVAEVTLENVALNASSYAGFFTMSSKTMFSVFSINTYTAYKNNLLYGTSATAIDGDRAFFNFGVRNVPAGNVKADGKTRLKLIKDGGDLYYFVNDVFVTKEYVERVNGIAQIGLFSNGPVKFSDWTYTSFDKGSVTVKDYLVKNNFVFITPQQTGSGTLTVSELTMLKGNDLQITVAANRKYMLAELYVNGQNKAEEFYANAVYGVWTISDLQEDVTVKAVFERVTADNWVDVSLPVYLGDTPLEQAVQYTVKDANGDLYYKGKSLDNGVIRVYLLKEGRYNAAGKVFETSGEYVLDVTYGDCVLLEDSKTLSLKNAGETFEKRVEFEPTTIGTVTVNGVSVTGQGVFIDNEDGTYQNEADKTMRQQYLRNSVLSSDYTINADISILENVSGIGGSMETTGAVVGIVIASGSGADKYVELKTCNWEQSYGHYICVRINGYEVSLGGFPADLPEGVYPDRFRKKDSHFRFKVVRIGDAMYVYNRDDVLGFIIQPNGITLINSALRPGHESKFKNINKQFGDLFAEEQVVGLYYVAAGTGKYLYDIKYSNEVNVGTYNINISEEFKNTHEYVLLTESLENEEFIDYSTVKFAVKNVGTPTHEYYLKYCYEDGKVIRVVGKYERYKRRVVFELMEGENITILDCVDETLTNSVVVNGETLNGTQTVVTENANSGMSQVSHSAPATVYTQTVANGDYMARLKLNTSQVAEGNKNKYWAGFRIQVASNAYLDIFSGHSDTRSRLYNGLYVKFTTPNASKAFLIDARNIANLASEAFNGQENNTLDLMLVRKGNTLALYYYTRAKDETIGQCETLSTWHILFSITFDSKLDSNFTTACELKGTVSTDQIVSPTYVQDPDNNFAWAYTNADYRSALVSAMQAYMQAGTQTAFAFRQENAAAKDRYYSIEVNDDDAAVAAFVANGENNPVNP